jgi:phytoene synthase
MAAPGLAKDDIAYLAGLVRESDRPRYYASLFAPAALRWELIALYGFAAEVERVPDQVSDPMLGEMRLQWWRDSLAGRARGIGDGPNPALRGVGAVVDRHSLPDAPLFALIEARNRDLYSDSPAGLADVEGFLGETQSALFQMAAIVCGATGPDTAEAAGHAGVAYGLARQLLRFASDRARSRTILPANLLATEDITADAVFALEPPAALHRVVSALAVLARHHLRNAEESLSSLSRQVRLPFLPLAVVPSHLDRIERLGPAIVARNPEVSDLESLLRIGWARLRS